MAKYTDQEKQKLKSISIVEIMVEKPCARDPRSPVPLTLAVQNSLTL
jgi:hypothetical protein